jgi:aspartyl/asparaginyl-tRNA synthetase
MEKIKFVVENEFKRVSYTEAIDILKNSKPNKKKKFDYLSKNGERTCRVSTSVIWLKNTLMPR